MIKIDDFKEIYILYEFVKISVEAILRKLKFKVYNILSRTMKNQKKKKTILGGTSLVVQWLGIHLPMQGTWVRALVREDPTWHGATKPASHNY